MEVEVCWRWRCVEMEVEVCWRWRCGGVLRWGCIEAEMC